MRAPPPRASTSTVPSMFVIFFTTALLADVYVDWSVVSVPATLMVSTSSILPLSCHDGAPSLQQLAAYAVVTLIVDVPYWG
ncbi:hypothetical protein Syun_026288 [Stephania yunnanensis]|uniref:Uncharacterized protein n=1 Tax=Stephania yunnanensis TaxID=152371 RepID=A0AAP0EYR9_9MAGN